jgi:carnosine N-methyltransferase
VRFPDVDPSSVVANGGALSLEFGDFTAISEAWAKGGDHVDAVITCFFIDTTHNPLDYLWAIRRVLRPGGIWVNLGPLHYHHPLNEGAVHLSLEQVYEAARLLGMEVTELPDPPPCSYRPEPPEMGSMRVEVYRPVLFVARREQRIVEVG